MKLSPSYRTSEGDVLPAFAANHQVGRAAQMSPSSHHRWRRAAGRWLMPGLALLAALLCLREAATQRREDEALGRLARQIVMEANARSHREIALALQRYLQAHIEFRTAPYHYRPFFRATASETLQSGKGYCGEVTRAFVKLAESLGVRAQRVNLYGKSLHVVGEVELENGERLIVDSQQPPTIPNLEPIEQVMLRPQFDEHSTLNVRRLGISSSFTGINLRFGRLATVTESPHALKALLWGALAAVLALTTALSWWLRWLLQRVVQRRLGQALERKQIPPEPLGEIERAPMEEEQAKDTTHEVTHWSRHLHCPVCRGALQWQTARTALACLSCEEAYPVVDGIPRLLPAALRAAISGDRATASVASRDSSRTDAASNEARKVATARSFGFEWQRFPEMHGEWEEGFWNYMAPNGAEVFRGRRVLDAGCGSGRHSFYAAKNGAEVWAVDLGSAVEVACKNNTGKNVHVVQADLCQLPFALESFDLVYSIGVLHHLSQPEAAFRNLLRYVKPGGRIHIYLYWKPEGQPVKRALLALVNGLRHVTTRLPHRVLYGLAYPAAAFAFAGFVLPYQMLSATGLISLAERLPMKQYARYPFRVCVNDQFDRFSAPIEHRYTREEVEGWLVRAGLQEIEVRPNFGWCATGRKAEV